MNKQHHDGADWSDTTITTVAHHRMRLAVLIDAENMAHNLCDALYARLKHLGDVRCARLYGDFSSAIHSGWRDPAKKYCIKPQQHFAAIPGKNTGDINLTIDAVDLIHSGHFDAICIVSNDSDFVPLAMRIRDAGMLAYGFGDVPPVLSSTAIWSPIPSDKEIGREEALFRRTDHRLPA